MTASQTHITPVPACELREEQIRRWSELQETDLAFQSPYFRPEFTLAVAAVCDNVEVAVLEQGGQTAGFFPYQRVRGKAAIPVGGIMCDYQGVVLRPGTTFSPQELLRSCDLVTWKFDHLLAEQTKFRQFHCAHGASSFLDVSGGCEAYLEEQHRAGRKRFFKRLRQQTNAMAREMGPLRLECCSTDPRVLETAIAWKREQYRRTKTMDIFQFPWTQPLLETIFSIRKPQFSGMLAALYAGDRLVAVDFGMRSGRVFHSWITSYDVDSAAKYSPGHLLTLELVTAAERLGIECIDLGKGFEPYKRNWTSGTIPLAEGVVDLRPVPRFLKASWIRTREWVKSSPLREAARRSNRMIQPMFQSLMVRSQTKHAKVGT